MFNFIKKLIYSTDKNSDVQYKDIEDHINNIFTGSQENLKLSSSDKLEPSKDFCRNKRFFQALFDKCADVVFREINIMSDSRYNAFCVYVANMIPQDIVEDTLNKLTHTPANYQYISDIKTYFKSTVAIGESDVSDDLKSIVDAITEGQMVFFINGINRGFLVDLTLPPSRAIEQPVTESVIRGPREGFTENNATNICLIRKKIKSSNLKVESFKVGTQTNTLVSMLYMANIANEEIIKEAKSRLSKIKIDSVLAASYIEEYIEDNPFSVFPTIFRTEKPDVACSKLLEGRIVLIIDSIPVALSFPAIFPEFFMSPDDYYLRFYVSTISRWARILSFSISLAMPGAFVALVTFHHELLPTPFVITLMRVRGLLPFPPIIEAVLMLTTYLILQEADLRMPKTMGQAVSVVGGLVLGQAAISAGIVGANMIIVVAITAVSALSIPTPELQQSIIYIRFFLLVLGGIGGMVGVTCGIILLIIHLISLRSFGVPYFAPMAPLKPKELFKDVLIRAPLWSMKKRPKTITLKDSKRRSGRPATTPLTEGDKLADNDKKQ